MAACSICHRPLSDPQSIALGIGPICRQQLAVEASGDRGGVMATLPFDWQTMNIVCSRKGYIPGKGRGTVQTNISQRYSTQRSPDGFEWGYGGSGPFAFAWDILALFIDPERAESYAAEFKDAFLVNIPMEGGVIEGTAVRAWIEQNIIPNEEDWEEFHQLNMWINQNVPTFQEFQEGKPK